MSSRQAVNVVHRLVRPAKAGHAGTLDPLATGVLVVCVGGATRLIEYVQRMPKRYVGTFLLGRKSPTEDIEGQITELPDAPVPKVQEIEAVARQFLGRIEQRPPIFSALKVKGRPAYKLARQGKPVELAPRPVEIHSIAVNSYDYPELVLEIDCGSGTYVRSLGRDLAEAMGTAAVMSALERTRIGEFHIENAIDPYELTSDTLLEHLLPPLRTVEYLPRVQLTSDETRDIRNGLTIPCQRPLSDSPIDLPLPLEEGRDEGNSRSKAEYAAIDTSGQLIGIIVPQADGQWRPMRNLPTG